MSFLFHIGHIGTLLGSVGFVLVAMTCGPALGADQKPGSPETLGAQAGVTARTNTQLLAQQGIQVPERGTEIRRGETVVGRERPELDPLGIRLGSFLVFPKLAVAEEVNDNIFAVEDDEQADLITRVQPSLRVRSDWTNHAVTFFGDADLGRHVDNTGENFEDFRFGATGRVDVQRSTNVSGEAGYQKRHEERSSPDDVNGKEPTEFDILTAALAGFHDFGRVTFTLGGAFERLDFDDVALGGGGIRNNDDRDRDEMEGSLRVAYEIVPEYEGFVRGSYSLRDYDDERDDAGVDRDSGGFEAIVGVRMDFGGIVFGDFFGGYIMREYDDSSLDTMDGPTVGADITWNVTRLTTITGTASRVIRETTTIDSRTGNTASGRFFSTLGLSVDHELLRNLLLGGQISVSQDDFEGIDRKDEIYRAGLSALYMMNRNLYLSGEYKFTMRDSEFANADFMENLFFVRLQTQF